MSSHDEIFRAQLEKEGVFRFWQPDLVFVPLSIAFVIGAPRLTGNSELQQSFGWIYGAYLIGCLLIGCFGLGEIAIGRHNHDAGKTCSGIQAIRIGICLSVGFAVGLLVKYTLA